MEISSTVFFLLFLYIYVIFLYNHAFLRSVVPSAVPSEKKRFCNELVFNALQGNSVVPSAVPSVAPPVVPPMESKICKLLKNKTLQWNSAVPPYFGFFRPVVPSEKKRFCKVLNNKMLQRNSAVPPVVPSVKNVICNKLIINMLQ